MKHAPRRIRSAALSLLTLGGLLGGAPAGLSAQTAVPAGNLGLPARMVDASGDRLLLGLRENAVAGVDHNGDGDLLDIVPLLVGTSGGGSVTYPLAYSSLIGSLDDRYLVVSVTEAEQAADLNGDGDLDDTAYGVIDLRTGALQMVPLAVYRPSARIAGNTMMFLVEEFEQGGTDLNGDGDFFDRVLHRRDLRTGVTTNMGLALRVSGHLRTDGHSFTAEVSQSAQGGIDLSGDGGTNGDVLHLIDAAGHVRNTGLVALGGFTFSDGTLLASIHESSSNDDIDGNGIATGASLVTMDARDGSYTYLGENNLFQSVHLPLATQGSNQFLWLELGFSPALNRFDSATGDLVPFDTLTSAQISNSQLVAAGDDLLVAEVVEVGADLNGDGDLLDTVWKILDSKTLAVVYDLQAASGGLADAAGDVVLTTISEAQQGNRDRNGDGDTLDTTLLATDLRTGRTHEIPRAVSSIATNGQLIAFTVSEAGQGATDLNGDGDTSDQILHVYDIRKGRLHDLHAATSAGNYKLVGRTIVFNVDEVQQGGLDLDGDGLAEDLVAHMMSF